MTQRGILSFFSPSGGGASKKKSETTPSKKRKVVHEEEDESRGSPKGPVLDSSESPVLKSKSKRRRMIVESDSETEEERGGGGGESAGGHEGKAGGHDTKAEVAVCKDGRTVNGDDEDRCQDESRVDSDVKTNGQVSATEQLLSPVRPARTHLVVNGGGDSSTEVVRTPPKRATARKHTGKRSSRPLYSTTSSPRPSNSQSDAQPSPKKRKVDHTMAVEETSTNNATSDGAQNGGGTETSRSQPAHGDVSVETKEGDSDQTKPQESSSDDKQGDSPASQPSDSGSSSPSGMVEREVDTSKDKDDGSTKTEKKTIHPFFASKASSKKNSKQLSKTSSSLSSSSKSSVKSTPSGGKALPSVTAAASGAGSGKGDNNKATQDTGYNPAQSDYHPVEDACWKKGDKIPYLAIAKTFERIEEESKRLKIVSILTNFFRSVVLLSPLEMVQCVYLCLNKLAPAYEGLELGIGESLLVKAIAGATGRKVEQIKQESVQKGDLGIVAETSRSTQRMMFAPPKLTVKAVYGKLKEIASMSGNASMSKKVDIIKGLIVACRKSEARYLIRSLGGKLRIGLAEQSVLTAIGHAVVFSPPSQDWPVEVVDASIKYSSEEFQKLLDEAALKVKTTYCEHPNYDALLPALISHGVDSLSDHCPLTPGIPLKPMLAHPTKGIQEVLKRFEGAEFTCEWKYDGERAQIHVLGGRGEEVKIYSRNSENNTSKYPDIIARMPKVLKDTVESCVIDAEAVAWDTDKHQILPFQILSTRKRKDADISEVKVQVCVFAFDLIYLNGKSLVREPFKVRRELLKSSFNLIEGEFMVAQSMDTHNVEQIQEFMDESIKGNCEGLMVKTLEKAATYEIARRSHNWLKLKKDYLEGVGDTLDLVVVGGFHGSGKRTGKYGGFLLACYDDEEEEFQIICKIGTGFKDEELTQHTEFLKNHILEKPKPYYRYNESGVIPDHWFDSVQVWEVKAADLSISPVYTAGAGIADPEKGISLRFPRFLRIRDDKKPEEATTSRQVADMYKSQQNIVKTTGSSHDPEDFY